MATKHWRFLGLGLMAVILMISAIVIWEFIDVLLLSLAVAYIVYPLAKWMSKGKNERSMRYLIISLVSVLIIIIPIVVSLVYSMNYLLQWLVKNIPAIHSGSFFNSVQAGLEAHGLGLFSERVTNELGKFITGFSGSFATKLLNPTFITTILIKVALFFVATFYFVYEGPRIGQFLKKHVPNDQKFLNELLLSFNKICYGLFVGHFFTSVIIAILAGVGFWFILSPSLLSLFLLIVVMFVIAFLPVIGPWFMYVPMGLWYIVMVPAGAFQGIALIVFGLIFLTLIPDFYIRPELVKRGSEIHPLLIILGFFGGPLVFGLKGIIIGPLVLGLAQALVQLYVKKRHILRELVEHF